MQKTVELNVPSKQLCWILLRLLDRTKQVLCSLRDSKRGLIVTAVVEEAIIKGIFNSDSGRSLAARSTMRSRANCFSVIEVSLLLLVTHEGRKWPAAPLA